ncbi:hypothetical protein ILUMI_19703 [Ignelater luminosus]|uniref:HAT C-terminal dimerisation domain-containing protein n=1 Tax=Ignelater luminosus TaxID=2038154 RepID=A0A8K0FZM4_IGNLU|nr:hypothetical protein ILUMI_19703 [Ignelater luminosus]
MDCTSKIIQKRFENKFTCAQTKSEAVIKRVLAPFAFDALAQELETSHFVSIFSDASNHKDIKLFPTLVRYFNTQNGISIKVVDVTSAPGETAEIISNLLLKVLDKNNLKNKLVAYCADNANTNFGGVSKKEWENVQKTLEFISEHFTANDIDESALFDEVTLIKNYATEQKIKERQEMKTHIDLRWVEIFQHFDVQQISYPQILQLVEFALCLPASNAPTERVFSIINNIWTSEKSQLTVETLKAMIVVRCNLGRSCEEFLLKI